MKMICIKTENEKNILKSKWATRYRIAKHLFFHIHFYECLRFMWSILRYLVIIWYLFLKINWRISEKNWFSHESFNLFPFLRCRSLILDAPESMLTLTIKAIYCHSRSFLCFLWVLHKIGLIGISKRQIFFFADESSFRS